MKLLMYTDPTSQRPQAGLVCIDQNNEAYVINLASLSNLLPQTLDEFVKEFETAFEQLAAVKNKPTEDRILLREVHILPPFSSPGKILCVGLNYRDHVLEGGRELPKFPTIFTKASTALIGNGDAILLPNISQQIDFEAELAVVIGKKAKKVRKEDALNYVAGYTIMNDVTARDYQKRSSQWTVGKSFDTFAPTGPFFVTADDIPDPHTLEIQAHLNGIEMQHSNTRNLIFDISYLIEDLSAVMTLQPGDMISTGTPSGVGVYRTPPVFLQNGDTIEITVENIGTLKNIVKEGH